MTEVDFARLRELATEIEQLKADGRWTKAEFGRVLDEGVKAHHGRRTLYIEFIVNEADPEWLEV